MRVMGMMSGTSADGIDVALARLSGAPPSISAKLERHHHVEFPARLREDILRLANGEPTTTVSPSIATEYPKLSSTPVFDALR